MPRKLFKRFLPSHDAVRGNHYLKWLGPRLHHPNLWHLNRRAVAGGVAIGMLCGMIPGPIQMICAALLALWLRLNLPVAVATTWYTNPFTIVPLYYGAYKLGALLSGDTSGASGYPDLAFSLDNIGAWIPSLLAWIKALGKPFVVGLAVLGVSLAAVSYFVVLGAWRLYLMIAWRQRKKRRDEGRGTKGEGSAP
jgi:uncharacterized protein (DUF2062 family)